MLLCRGCEIGRDEPTWEDGLSTCRTSSARARISYSSFRVPHFEQSWWSSQFPIAGCAAQQFAAAAPDRVSADRWKKRISPLPSFLISGPWSDFAWNFKFRWIPIERLDYLQDFEISISSCSCVFPNSPPDTWTHEALLLKCVWSA